MKKKKKPFERSWIWRKVHKFSWSGSRSTTCQFRLQHVPFKAREFQEEVETCGDQENNRIMKLLGTSEIYIVIFLYLYIDYTNFKAKPSHRIHVSYIHIFHDNGGVVSVVLFFLSFFLSLCLWYRCVRFFRVNLCPFCCLFFPWVWFLFIIFLFCSFLWIKDDWLSELFSSFSIWCWWDVANSFQM